MARLFPVGRDNPRRDGRRIDRRTATEFSFFLAIPTMFAATGFELFAHHDWLEAGDALWLAVSFAVSFAVALLTLCRRRGREGS